MEKWVDELITGFSKIWTWVLYIILGVMGKFSYDALNGRRMSLGVSLGILGLSIFVGAIVSILCVYYEAEKAGAFLVPLCTLLSEKLIVALYAYNWKEFVSDMLGYWRDKLKK